MFAALWTITDTPTLTPDTVATDHWSIHETHAEAYAAWQVASELDGYYCGGVFASCGAGDYSRAPGFKEESQ